jgi:hypothetical protein
MSKKIELVCEADESYHELIITNDEKHTLLTAHVQEETTVFSIRSRAANYAHASVHFDSPEETEAVAKLLTHAAVQSKRKVAIAAARRTKGD